jgi:hypothetical protein
LWKLDGTLAAEVGLQISALDLDVSQNVPLLDALLVAPPLRPTGVTATPGNGSAAVSWQQPQTQQCIFCGPLTGYTVYVNGSATQTTTGATSTATTITGLQNGQTYTITVAADAGSLGPIGGGGQSTPVQVTPTVAARPATCQTTNGSPSLHLFPAMISGLTATINGVVIVTQGSTLTGIDWNWGDGTTLAGCSYFPQSHAYAHAGDYTVTVTTTGTNGFQLETTEMVSVS